MHTVCDIPEDFNLVEKEYTIKIPHLDLSEMISNKESLAPWYVHYLQEPVKSKLISKCSTRGVDTKEVILGEILQTYPDRVESALNTHQRCEKFKQHVFDYLNDVSLDEQVAIVGHSMYFSYMTATEWPLLEDESAFDYTKAPTKYRFLNNCEFYPFDSHLNLQSNTSATCSPNSVGSGESINSSTSSSASD